MNDLTTNRASTADFKRFSSKDPLRIFLHQIDHELDEDLYSDPKDDQLLIPPSSGVTVVKVTSRVSSNSASAFRSPKYVASKRRKMALEIVSVYQRVRPHIHSDDLPLYFHRVLSRLHELIRYLDDVEREGNACEVARLLRDSIMNGGWDDYRKENAFDAVVGIFSSLANRDEFAASDVYVASEQLANLGMRTLPQLDLMYDEEEADEAFD